MARTYSTEDDKVKQILDFDESNVDNNFVYSRQNHLKGKKNPLAAKAIAFFDHLFVKVIAVLLIVVILRFIYTSLFGQVNWTIVDDITPDSELDQHNKSDVASSKWETFLWKFGWAAFYGIAVTVFTWMITYMDSVQPGINPPTPVSPRKLRDRSGHTFHMGYVMAFVNGFATFAMTLWYAL